MNNYFKQLMKIATEVEGKSGIHLVSISHDNWCNKLKNDKKECNCNPDVEKQVKE